MLAPKLIAITAVSARGLERTLRAMEELCRRAQPGCVAVHLREREMPGVELLQLAERLRRLTRQYDQRLVINDRLDIAWLCRADVVHLTEQSVSARRARELFARRGEQVWISRAWHRAEQLPHEPAEQARVGDPRVAGVNAWVLSPVVEARKGALAVGSTGLARFAARLRRAAQRPPEVYALGGVHAASVRECLAAGATGVAAIGAAYDEPEALLGALGVLRRD